MEIFTSLLLILTIFGFSMYLIAKGIKGVKKSIKEIASGNK